MTLLVTPPQVESRLRHHAIPPLPPQPEPILDGLTPARSEKHSQWHPRGVPWKRGSEIRLVLDAATGRVLPRALAGFCW